MNDTAQTKESGLVVALAVLGLILGILALVGSMIPLLGILALYISIPAMLISLFAVVAAYSMQARKALPVGALVVCLVAVGISTFQYLGIKHIGNEARKNLQKKGLIAPAEKQSAQTAPIKKSVPGPPIPCRFGSAGGSQNYGLLKCFKGSFLIPGRDAQERFPLFSKAPQTALAFGFLNSNYLQKLEMAALKDEYMKWTGVKYSEIDGFQNTYENARSLDPYALAEKRTEIINELLRLHEPYKQEYNDYLNTIFYCVFSAVVKEGDYDFDSQTLTFMLPPLIQNPSDRGLSPRVKLDGQNGRIGWKTTRTTRLPLQKAKSFFSSYPGTVGNRKGNYMITYYIQPLPPQEVGLKGGYFIFKGVIKKISVDFLGDASFNVTLTAPFPS